LKGRYSLKSNYGEGPISPGPLRGRLGGEDFLLEDSKGNTLAIQTRIFSSAESRDAAILTSSASLLEKGKTAGILIVVGDQVISVTPATAGILSHCCPEIRQEQGIR
jgi:hypothetical protein